MRIGKEKWLINQNVSSVLSEVTRSNKISLKKREKEKKPFMMKNVCLYVHVVVFITLPLVIPKRSRSDTAWVTAQDQNAVVDDNYTDEDNDLCRNVDIRNNLARLHYIENCTVITGFLQLVLIERVPHEEFVKYNISKLR